MDIDLSRIKTKNTTTIIILTTNAIAQPVIKALFSSFSSQLNNPNKPRMPKKNPNKNPKPF